MRDEPRIQRVAASDPARQGLSRVLVVTRNLPPLWGGMERLNLHLVRSLASHLDVQVVGPGGAGASLHDVPLHPVPPAPLGAFLLASAWRATVTARRWRPDVVLAGSGVTAPAAFLAARASGARAAVYTHGLDVATRHPLYRAVWHPILRRMDRVIVNSRATGLLADAIGVAPERMRVVPPGTNPGVLVDAGAIRALRTKLGAGDRPVLLAIGRLTERKGVREWVTQSLPRIVAARPDCSVWVVGDEPKGALAARGQSIASIRAAADAQGLARHLEFIGAVTDDNDLATLYAAADVHVFPVRELAGDPEGFGMVAIEAAAQGTPTVAFATGGVLDAVAEGRSGYLVPPGDYHAFADTVLRVLEQPQALRESSVLFAREFAWPRFADRVAAALS